MMALLQVSLFVLSLCATWNFALPFAVRSFKNNELLGLDYSGERLTVTTVERIGKSSSTAESAIDHDTNEDKSVAISSRRSSLSQMALVTFSSLFCRTVAPASATQCTDIESCREIGEQKAEEAQRQNPTVSLDNGVSYKIVRSGTGEDRVRKDSALEIIYSINMASAGYMYSKGFGFEKVNIGGKMQSDLGLDSLRVQLGKRDIPQGIEEALVGMKRGERRRILLPPSVGFETSNWKPEPTTARGKATIESYKRKLSGFASQPPFPASTIWDVEVLKIRA